MGENLVYQEKISSRKTEYLFVALTILFFVLFVWRITASSFGVLGSIFLIFFCFFLFYSLNYRMLVVCLTFETLTLRFGIFTWKISMTNVSECELDDDIPALKKYGGAGIHFMVVHKRYRASFNFLEYSRVVVKLKRKMGLVKDISFSTQHPNELVQLMQQTISTNENPNLK